MLYPPWLKLAVPILVAAILFGAGWKVSAWRSSGKVEKATAAKEKAETEARTATTFRNACVKDVARIKADLILMSDARDVAAARYEEAVARPPEVVVRYEERWHTIRDEVVSEECHVALGELYSWIHTLPAYAEEVPHE